MNYKETTTFLFRQLPMYQRQGVAAFKKDLKNIIALCTLLDNPQEKFKSIHIAGTNGKGSVAHIIAAGLQANGYKVALYTSPHYKDYRERIKINGTFITEQAVIDFVENYKEAFLKIQPSFFEITVALALQYFADQKVDVAIIETGLGGRLDSTNVLLPILSIITNISLDHQSMLGSTLTEIAFEKAGIIKPNIPVIIGETQQDIYSIFEKKSIENKSQITVADQVSHLDIVSKDQTEYNLNFNVNDLRWIENIKTSLTNAYQLKNINTALFALYSLKNEFKLDPISISNGVSNIHKLTHYIGRWMTVSHKPTIILDSAHNEAGVHHLTNQIAQLEYSNLHIVWGTVSDKDISKILSILPKDAQYYFAKADIPRGMDSTELMSKAKLVGLDGYDYSSVLVAFRIAKANAGEGDLIIIAGSIFVVAEVM
ncbi:MAG: folylpolyglutamate synthase/dihydrofolate synthase family protein [Saprospiraceae bacterium]